jgi:hypothetical protein
MPETSAVSELIAKPEVERSTFGENPGLQKKVALRKEKDELKKNKQA